MLTMQGTRQTAEGTIQGVEVGGRTQKGLHGYGYNICPVCGEVIATNKSEHEYFVQNGTIYRNELNGRYYHKSCLDTNNYSFSRHGKMGTKKPMGLIYGVEYESNHSPSSYQIRAELADLGLYGTEDRTVEEEFKLVPQYGLNTMPTIVKTAFKYLDFEGSNIGSHITMGMASWNDSIQWFFECNLPTVMREVARFMRENPQITKKVFGRNFAHYAEYTEHNFVHGSWLNFRRISSKFTNCSIEYRICKATSEKQFMDLHRMLKEFTICLNKWATGEKDAQWCTKNIINWITKTYNGTASFQKR